LLVCFEGDDACTQPQTNSNTNHAAKKQKLVLAAALAAAMFLLVPRGVSVGAIDVRSTRMSFNATTLTYRIVLAAHVPIYNPNYVGARVAGNLSVSFYDAEAGSTEIKARAPPRALPYDGLDVSVDASNLPRKYTQVVYSHCFNWPRKLIFFLRGQFTVTYLGAPFHLPSVDTYFVLDCSKAAAASSRREAGGGGGGQEEEQEVRLELVPAYGLASAAASSPPPLATPREWRRRRALRAGGEFG
jgi:hypothetical protein